MRFFTPALRTRRYGHRLLTARVVALVGLFTWLAPVVVGGILVGVSAILMPNLNGEAPWVVFPVAGGLMMLAPLYGIILVPLGLLLGAWAMRFGWAGWGIAAVASVALPLVIEAVRYWANPTGEDIGALLIMIPVVVVHAAMMWIATRYLCPESLLPASAA